MEFKGYQHVERLGKPETEGILNGHVTIQPKLDGTNMFIAYDRENDKLIVGSRRRFITPEDDNHGVARYVEDNKEKYLKFFKINPDLTLWGEFLVKGTVKNYLDDAWRKFYVFDVTEGGKYIPYRVYESVLKHYGIEYVPIMAEFFNPTEDEVKAYALKATFLCKEGTTGEGCIIKNYSFVNKFGRVQWAKVVNESFKSKKHTKKANRQDVTVGIEYDIVEKFITDEYIKKEFNKMENYQSSDFGKFLGTFFYTFLCEEIADIVVKNKTPTIDFRLLRSLIIERVKEVIL
jgi:hypothetical protein|nr:MAG TPA: ATP-dependent DNA ligase [Caudoviricetes sp.]